MYSKRPKFPQRFSNSIEFDQYDSFDVDFSHHMVKRVFLLVVCLSLLYSKRQKLNRVLEILLSMIDLMGISPNTLLKGYFSFLFVKAHCTQKGKNFIEVWYFY